MACSQVRVSQGHLQAAGMISEVRCGGGGIVGLWEVGQWSGDKMEAQDCSCKVMASVSAGLMRESRAQGGSHIPACVLFDPAVEGGVMTGSQ